MAASNIALISVGGGGKLAAIDGKLGGDSSAWSPPGSLHGRVIYTIH